MGLSPDSPMALFVSCVLLDIVEQCCFLPSHGNIYEIIMLHRRRGLFDPAYNCCWSTVLIMKRICNQNTQKTIIGFMILDEFYMP